MWQKCHTFFVVDNPGGRCYNVYTLSKQELELSYTVFYRDTEFGTRKGLEGPFRYPNGRVLYYDTAEGQYWDPLTDFYVPNDELASLQNQIFDLIRG